ncbi:hypothetical protein RPN242_gp030 [Escherichia phage vB_EcoM-RPN242]|nr:hypothetical protein RPN242_gp030 [Escherichia phage vB_EcoM-RPN242]
MADFKKTIDKIKVLNTKGLSQAQKQLSYPLDVTGGKTLGHYVLFNINRISGSSYGNTATQTIENPIQNPLGNTPVVYGSKSGSITKYAWARHVRSNESIVLCMPEYITTNYGVGWNGSELGLAGMGAQFLSRAAQDMTQFKLGDALNVGKEMGRFAATKAIQSASEAIPFLPSINAHDTLELFTGTMTNPYVEMIFQGVRNREIPFTFKFTPRSQKEAKMVREIIRMFKMHMYPEYKYNKNSSAFYLHPSTFDITFMVNGGRNQWLHRISTCVLSNMFVNETPDSSYAVHKDDGIVSTQVDMTFIELEPLHKGRFETEGDSF